MKFAIIAPDNAVVCTKLCNHITEAIAWQRMATHPRWRTGRLVQVQPDVIATDTVEPAEDPDEPWRRVMPEDDEPRLDPDNDAYDRYYDR